MSRTRALVTAALVAALWPASAQAADCRALTHEGAEFTICEIDAGTEVIRLFHSTPEGEVLGSFPRVDQMLRDRGERLAQDRFLEDVDVTFRRDHESHRPRINKRGSRKDREQKASGEYFHLE